MHLSVMFSSFSEINSEEVTKYMDEILQDISSIFKNKRGNVDSLKKKLALFSQEVRATHAKLKKL